MSTSIQTQQSKKARDDGTFVNRKPLKRYASSALIDCIQKEKGVIKGEGLQISRAIDLGIALSDQEGGVTGITFSRVPFKLHNGKDGNRAAVRFTYDPSASGEAGTQMGSTSDGSSGAADGQVVVGHYPAVAYASKILLRLETADEVTAYAEGYCKENLVKAYLIVNGEYPNVKVVSARVFSRKQDGQEGRIGCISITMRVVDEPAPEPAKAPEAAPEPAKAAGSVPEPAKAPEPATPSQPAKAAGGDAGQQAGGSPEPSGPVRRSAI